METLQITQHLQGLLNRHSEVLTEEDKQIIEQVCSILQNEPDNKINLELIIKLLIQVLAFGSHLHH
jgi:hypothetical protein